MTLAAIAVVVGAAAGLLAGRHPRPALRAGAGRGEAALLLAGVLAAAAARLPLGRTPCTVVAAGGYALVALAAGRLRRHPGLAAVAAGVLANLTVVVADRGMPVRSMVPGAVDGLHHGLTTADHLRGLADVVSVPVLHIVVSPGDLVVSAGAALAAFTWLTAPAGAVAGRSDPARGARPAAR